MNYKLNLLDKAIASHSDGKWTTFRDWSGYETQVFEGMVKETAKVVKLHLFPGCGNLIPTEHTHTGSMGMTHDKTDYFVEFSGGELHKVGPSEITWDSNYAYEKPGKWEGTNIGDWLEIMNEDWSTVNRIVKVTTNFSEWNETCRFREVVIYAKDHEFKVLLDSFQGLTHKSPWILMPHTKPKTVYGHFNMDMSDIARIKKMQKKAWDDHYEEQSVVRDLMKFYFGTEKAKELENWMCFGV